MTVLAVLESTFPSFCLSYEIQYQEVTVTVFTVLAVVAVSVVTATPPPPPLNSTPLVRHSDFLKHRESSSPEKPSESGNRNSLNPDNNLTLQALPFGPTS